MTIDEIKQAKREAEERIREVLQQLEVNTGMQFNGLDVRATEERFGPRPPFSVMRVSIGLRVP